MAYARHRDESEKRRDGGPLMMPAPGPDVAVKHFRTLFLSDIHLGTIGCRAQEVLRFLDEYRAERVYLLGDILDVWSNRNIFSWPREQIAVLRRLLGMAEEGVEVYYILGNHDRMLGTLTEIDLGNIHIRRELIHETADNRRVLLTHGDAYDSFVVRHEWVAKLAARSYHFVTVFDRLLNRATGRIAPVDIARQVRLRSKQLTDCLSRFAQTVSEETRRRELHGVICGHMHRPEIARICDIDYHNVGDWVEHCTALVEDFTGRLELIHYPPQPE